jgi:CDP-diacylglycerol---glycerol-3-phosphate 3-phosphatidyltransferase
VRLGWCEAELFDLDHLHSANLNQSYFTNRQDRYVYFKSQRLLAQYCSEFLNIVSRFSFRMRHSPSSSVDYELHWPNVDTLPHELHGKANEALLALQSSSWRPALVQDSGNELALIVPIIQAGQLNIREEEQCMTLLFNSIAKQQQRLPTAQRPLIDLTSGYFGLYAPYQDLILNSHADCRIIVASPSVRRLSIEWPRVWLQLDTIAGERVLWI